MKVLVVGSGGREHAICWKISQSPKVDKIYCAPGNAGIAEVAECVDIKAMEFDKLVAFAKENAIDLTVIGMDDPLVGGIVDDERREQLRSRLETADTDFGIARKVKEQPVKVFKRLERTKLCEDRDFYDHFVHDKYNPCPLHKVCFGSKLHAKLGI